MATRNFKHVETLPLDEDNLVIGSNTEGNLRSKSCINLSFVSVNAVERLSRLNKINAKALGGDLNTFLSISYIIESFLMVCLTQNSISNGDNTDLTEHYKRRLITVANSKILPSFKYCQDLTFAGFKTWGGLYGSLQYYIHIREQYEEYYTPSQITHYSVLQLTELSQSTAYNYYLETNFSDYRVLSEAFNNLKNQLANESSDADSNIYGFPKSLLIGIPSISNIVRDLRFYETWIRNVYEWYIGRVARQEPIAVLENPVTNRERALNTLIRVGNLLAQKGLDEKAFKDAYIKFARQNINVDLYDVLDEIITIRKISTYVELEEVERTFEEELVLDFHQTISILTDPLQYREASNLLLSSVCPPGGFVLLQQAVATTLINRAYILAYKQINNPTAIQDTDVYKRIIKLLGLAGITLIRTGRPAIQATGVNLLRTFNLNLTGITPSNILDLES